MLAKKAEYETVETENFSQSTLDLLRVRTHGVHFLTTGRRGSGGRSAAYFAFLAAVRKLAGTRYSLTKKVIKSEITDRVSITGTDNTVF